MSAVLESWCMLMGATHSQLHFHSHKHSFPSSLSLSSSMQNCLYIYIFFIFTLTHGLIISVTPHVFTISISILVFVWLISRTHFLSSQIIHKLRLDFYISSIHIITFIPVSIVHFLLHLHLVPKSTSLFYFILFLNFNPRSQYLRSFFGHHPSAKDGERGRNPAG